jgi:dihydroneopterin aldolase
MIISRKILDGSHVTPLTQNLLVDIQMETNMATSIAGTSSTSSPLLVVPETYTRLRTQFNQNFMKTIDEVTKVIVEFIFANSDEIESSSSTQQQQNIYFTKQIQTKTSTTITKATKKVAQSPLTQQRPNITELLNQEALLNVPKPEPAVIIPVPIVAFEEGGSNVEVLPPIADNMYVKEHEEPKAMIAERAVIRKKTSRFTLKKALIPLVLIGKTSSLVLRSSVSGLASLGSTVKDASITSTRNLLQFTGQSMTQLSQGALIILKAFVMSIVFIFTVTSYGYEEAAVC